MSVCITKCQIIGPASQLVAHFAQQLQRGVQLREGVADLVLQIRGRRSIPAWAASRKPSVVLAPAKTELAQANRKKHTRG